MQVHAPPSRVTSRVRRPSRHSVTIDTRMCVMYSRSPVVVAWSRRTPHGPERRRSMSVGVFCASRGVLFLSPFSVVVVVVVVVASAPVPWASSSCTRRRRARVDSARRARQHAMGHTKKVAPRHRVGGVGGAGAHAGLVRARSRHGWTRARFGLLVVARDCVRAFAGDATRAKGDVRMR